MIFQSTKKPKNYYYVFLAIKWCSKPTLNSNSKVLNMKDAYYYNDTLSVFCDAGYDLKGQTTITCQADKTWGNLPKCNGNVLYIQN